MFRVPVKSDVIVECFWSDLGLNHFEVPVDTRVQCGIRFYQATYQHGHVGRIYIPLPADVKEIPGDIIRCLISEALKDLESAMQPYGNDDLLRIKYYFNAVTFPVKNRVLF
jgi:hypothetical protein